MKVECNKRDERNPVCRECEKGKPHIALAGEDVPVYCIELKRDTVCVPAKEKK